ncbi:MAG: MATE family efflux transporter [Candidatus Ornithospirochaeta sp.]
MTIDMTKGSVLPLFLKFSLPVIGGNIFQLLYTLSDTIIVGQTIGEGALAAVGSTGVVVYFFLNFIQGFSGGFGIILSHSFGRGDQSGVKKSIASSIYLSIFFTLAITLIFAPLTAVIVKWMRIPGDIEAEAVEYLSIIILGTFATVLYNAVSSLLRAMGDSRIPLLLLVVSSLVNVVLDIVFIVPMGMGVGGAALATVVAQALSAFLSTAFAIYKYPVFRLEKKDFRPDEASIKNHFRTGFLMGFQMSVMCIGIIAMQKSVNVLGTEAIAGYTAAGKADQINAAFNLAYSSTIATFVAQNYGCGDYGRIKKGVRVSLLVVTVSAIAVGGVMMALRNILVPLFVNDPSPMVSEYVRQFFVVNVPFYPLLGLIFVYRTSVQSMDISWAPFAACIAELMARCIFSVVLGNAFGYLGIMFVNPISWFSAVSVVLPAYLANIKRLMNARRPLYDTLIS